MGRTEKLPLSRKTKKCTGNVLDAWMNNDLPTFVENLDSNVFDHIYTEHKNLRLLELIVSEKPVKLEFLQEALKFSPRINAFCKKARYVAIHFAVCLGNFEAFWCLYNAGADPNVQDRDGDTILHYIAQHYEKDPKGYQKLLSKLLGLSTVAFNVPNLKGKTPVAVAAKKGYEEIVQEFLKLGPLIDLDTFQDRKEQTARTIIKNKLPQCAENLPGSWQPRDNIFDFRYRLFYFLTASSYKNEKNLQKIFQEALTAPTIKTSELFQCINARGLTLLQNAVQLPKPTAMQLFLKAGADVNYAPPGTDRAIFIAARNKNLSCFTDLLSRHVLIPPNDKKETLLHVLVKNRGLSLSHTDALQKTLRKTKEINAKDVTGQTALHVAVTHASEATIFQLLDNGARLDIANNCGETPLAHLRAETYGNYLNTKISIKEEVAAQDLKYTILFDYKFISSGNGTEHVHDISTKPLETILKSKEHRKYLAHPVIAAILFFKWKKIRWLFYCYLFLSTLFCVLFTTFLYLRPHNSCTSIDNSMLVIQIVLWTYLIFRGMWEVIDLFFSYQQYLTSAENYLQLAMIIFSVMSLSYNCTNNSQHCRAVSAFAVLFAWIELFFIIGKHPKTNSFIGMFRKATWFLLQFLAVHTALILAFVFSFYVMFQNEPGKFESIPKAFFKTLVMVSGEYEVNDIPFDSLPVVSHILFVLFLFLVAIVLFNLLIGLAVSATRPIEDDSFLYRCTAQVPIVSLIERIFFKHLKFLKIKLCGDKATKREGTHPVLAISPNKTKKLKIIVRKDDLNSSRTIDGIIKFKHDRKIQIRHVLSKRIVEDAQKIIAAGDPFLIERKIENVQNQLDDIKMTLEKLLNRLDIT